MYFLWRSPIVVAAFEALDCVITGGRTVWTAWMEITSALPQARNRWKGGTTQSQYSEANKSMRKGNADIKAN